MYDAKFELTEAACELVHMNTRIEKHGDEDKLAIDLDLRYETNNAALAMFSPTLRSCLYEKAPDLLADADKTDSLTKLRNPALNSGKFGWGMGELVGATLTVHSGIDSKSNVEFDETKVGKYKLECKEGGTVVVHFQAQVYPSEKQTGFLAKALQNKICTVSVVPPGQ